MSAKAPASRPLRAAGAIIGGWIALRTVLLLGDANPSGPPPPAVAPAQGHERPARPAIEGAIVAPVAATARATALAAASGHAQSGRRAAVHRETVSASSPTVTIVDDGRGSIGGADSSAVFMLDPADALPSSQTGVVPSVLAGAARARNRFQLSAWSLVRGAADTGNLAPGGVLGGSQVGARGWFEPGPRGLALTARISSPLRARTGSEASLGLGYRRGTVGVIVEERFSLDPGGGARPSVTAFGGLSDVRLPLGFRLDSYAQAGIVGLRNRAGFADGAVRIEHGVLGRKARISAGAGAWGGAQPGLARLDLGPQIAVRLPVLGGTLRVSGEWRFRIGGNAAPGSGPTLGVGADF